MRRPMIYLGCGVVAFAVWSVWSGRWTIPGTPDAVVDWLILRAGWDGSVNPASPTLELARHYGVAGVFSSELEVVRPPAFFVLHSPGLIGYEAYLWSVRALNVPAALVVGWLAARIWRIRYWWVLSGAALVLGFGAISWGKPELVWIACIAATWYLALRGDWWWAGIPLGVAAAVKLWPAIVIVTLVAVGRRRTAVSAIAIAVCLSLVGLLAPGVSVSSTWTSLVGGSEWALIHPSNLSLSALLARIDVPMGVTVAIGVMAAWWAGRLGIRRGVGVSVVLGLLVTPIAWSVYWVASIPYWPAFWVGRQARVETAGAIDHVRPNE